MRAKHIADVSESGLAEIALRDRTREARVAETTRKKKLTAEVLERATGRVQRVRGGVWGLESLEILPAILEGALEGIDRAQDLLGEVAALVPRILRALQAAELPRHQVADMLQQFTPSRLQGEIQRRLLASRRLYVRAASFDIPTLRIEPTLPVERLRELTGAEIAPLPADDVATSNEPRR